MEKIYEIWHFYHYNDVFLNVLIGEHFSTREEAMEESKNVSFSLRLENDELFLTSSDNRFTYHITSKERDRYEFELPNKKEEPKPIPLSELEQMSEEEKMNTLFDASRVLMPEDIVSVPWDLRQARLYLETRYRTTGALKFSCLAYGIKEKESKV